jgi:hypothetical protein
MRGKHVHLVDEVHLVARARGRVLHVVQQLPRVVHFRARRGVHLDEIHEATGVDLQTCRARAARFRCHTLRGVGSLLAVETLGEDAGDGGLAHPAGAREEKGVVHAAALERIAERTHHVLLAHQLSECPGSILARQRGIGHWNPIVRRRVNPDVV